MGQSSRSASFSRSVFTGTVGTATNTDVVLNELLRDCCLELMASYGLDATPERDTSSSDSPPCCRVAALDFLGRELRGTIGLCLTPNLLLHSYLAAPGSPSHPDDRETADWNCELVNQLVGRLKNKLRSYDVSFQVNVPRMLANVPSGTLRKRFVCDRGSFSSYLDVRVSPGFALQRNSVEPPSLREGEFLLL